MGSRHVNHLAIIAGGLGTRLAGVTGDLPKVLVPVAGKPLLQYHVEMAVAAGIQEITLFAGHLAGKIVEFIGDGSRLGVHARVVVEKEPMGNAGSLVQSLDSLPAHFFILYGDVMLAVDLPRMAKQHLDRDADFTLFAHSNDHPHDSDLLETDASDWVTTIHTCPHPSAGCFDNLINAGLYVARRDALRPFSGSNGKLDFIKNIVPKLLAKDGRVLAYRSREYIKDLGTHSRLQKVEADWRAGNIRLESAGRSRSAIFLDRDGTLNVERDHLQKAEDLELLPGVAPALKSLRQSGYYLVVLTNQPVIARGEASEEDVAAIHRRLGWELGKQGAYLDAIYVCPHHPDRGFPGERVELKVRCNCRKPGTGLFERACRDLRIDAANSWMVGDQTRDIEIAKRAGLRSVLLQTGRAGRDGQFPALPDHVARDFASAADIILQHRKIAAQ